MNIRYIIRKSILLSLLFFYSLSLMPITVKGQTLDYEEPYQRALAFEAEYADKNGLSDWAVFALARANALTEQQKQTYLASLKTLLEEKKGILSKNRSTEYSRAALAVTALGIDADNVYGYSLLEPLSCYDFTVQQGISGGIYALLVLDSAEYELPEAPKGYTQTTRENLVSYLLGRQLSDGGWAVSGKYADADTTAAVIAALFPYYKEETAVKEAVDAGLCKLSSMMSENGGYLSYGTENAESTAQVIVAMSIYGISLDEGSFVKGDNTILDGLFAFQLADGSFEHTKGGGFSQMATLQSLYALVAQKRMQEGQASLYRMTDVPRDNNVAGGRRELDLETLWADFKEEQEEEEKPIGKTIVRRKKLKVKKNNAVVQNRIAQTKQKATNTQRIAMHSKRKTKHTSAKSNGAERIIFPSPKQGEISLLMEQGISFTVQQEEFKEAFVLSRTVDLTDGDYVLCRYIDADEKPEVLAKVWVEEGILTANIKEPGEYFVAKRVRDCSVSALTKQQAQQNQAAKSGREDSSSSGGKKEVQKSGGMKASGWIVGLLIIGIVIGWKLCRYVKKS